jgi:hypothetical protein
MLIALGEPATQGALDAQERGCGHVATSEALPNGLPAVRRISAAFGGVEKGENVGDRLAAGVVARWSRGGSDRRGRGTRRWKGRRLGRSGPDA